MRRFANIDEQIAALAPLTAHVIALLAGYSSHRQFNDYRVKGKDRLMPDARLERLATRLEQLAALARNLMANPTPLRRRRND